VALFGGSAATAIAADPGASVGAESGSAGADREVLDRPVGVEVDVDVAHSVLLFEPGDEPLAEVLRRELPREEEGRLGEFHLFSGETGSYVSMSPISPTGGSVTAVNRPTARTTPLNSPSSCLAPESANTSTASRSPRYLPTGAITTATPSETTLKNTVSGARSVGLSPAAIDPNEVVLRYSATTATPSRPVTPSGISARKYQR